MMARRPGVVGYISVSIAEALHGTLAYLSGGTFTALARRTLVWVDRQGREEPLGASPRAYQQPRLAPDNTRVALSSLDEKSDLLVWDLARKKLTQLTFDPALDQAPPLDAGQPAAPLQLGRRRRGRTESLRPAGPMAPGPPRD
jgi:hypothetical protein